jgi:hypothetical protein
MWMQEIPTSKQGRGCKVKVSIDDVFCKSTTAQAALLVIDGDEYWIPQSQIEDESEVWKKGDEGTLVISEWIAEQKGIM